MKIIETKDGQKARIINTVKKVDVIPTEKHPAFEKTGKKPRQVPENMIPHLVKKGMIDDPNGKPAKK